MYEGGGIGGPGAVCFIGVLEFEFVITAAELQRITRLSTRLSPLRDLMSDGLRLRFFSSLNLLLELRALLGLPLQQVPARVFYTSCGEVGMCTCTNIAEFSPPCRLFGRYEDDGFVLFIIFRTTLVLMMWAERCIRAKDNH